MKKLLIADDHPLFLEALEHRLQGLDAPVEIHKAGSLDEVLAIFDREVGITLAIVDLVMPGMDGLEGLKKLKQHGTGVPVVVVSATESQARIREAIQQGVSGYIPKSASSEEFLEALQQVLAGGIYMPPQLWARAEDIDPDGEYKLSNRQREILELMADGLSNKLIADRLSLKEGTVKIHVSATLKSLNARNRTHAVRRARELKILT